MAVAKSILLTLLTITIIFSTAQTTTALPPETLTNAVETLSNSGYIAMSLTLTAVSDGLLSHHNAATIFSPPDIAFADYGQPSLPLLSVHISPMVFSLSTLRSLPFGTKIPTVDESIFLTVTTSSPNDVVSINDVRIIGSSIFDDGSLIVYGIENFLDPNFTVPDSPIQISNLNHCTASFRGNNGSISSFHDAANVLISRGYSVFASFLNLQLLGFQFQSQSQNKNQSNLTVFAPNDEVMVEYSGRFPDYQSLFHRHVLNCKVSWTDLMSVDDGISFDTYLDGFKVKVDRSGGGGYKVNEVSITSPDMYYSDWIVIHGIGDVLSLPKPADEVGDGEEDQDDGDDPGDETLVRSSGRMLIAAAPDRCEF
uniref:putative fasciclin-like arabinogalactan protein 20 n=1 Tax=Erigeron canadensis TaxID=72917 RepID=UPI001CB9D6A5|nr:putative fasciclin-like arabinogalactan protein 20 [Erigeron canadensis]